MKNFAALSLAVYLQPIASEDLHVGRHGNVDVTIKGVAKKRSTLFLDSNNSHRQTANLQQLSDWIRVWKKLVFDISAQHHYQRRPLHFVIRNETTLRDRLIFDVDHV